MEPPCSIGGFPRQYVCVMPHGIIAGNCPTP